MDIVVAGYLATVSFSRLSPDQQYNLYSNAVSVLTGLAGRTINKAIIYVIENSPSFDSFVPMARICNDGYPMAQICNLG